jgi:hypothetical protein
MKYIYRECSKFGYFPNRFAEMITNNGAVATAKQLVMKNESTEGFTKLCLNKKLHLSIEAYVISPKYKELFTEEEIQKSKNRLEEYGYKL